MFKNPTVFVLGAGASWHYGYPTGEGLVEKVIVMAERLSQYCNWRLESGQVLQFIPRYVAGKIDRNLGVKGARDGWKSVQEECHVLIDRLKAVRPLVIDFFLAWNESLRPIGRLMIAAVILECEAAWLRENANQNRRESAANVPIRPSDKELERIDITKYRDDWYRFIVHKLVYGCRESKNLLENDVHFITFNYDTSLEHHLSRALRAIDLMKSDDVESFLSGERIVHVYGSVRGDNPVASDPIDFDVANRLGGERPWTVSSTAFEVREAFLNRCYEAAEFLQTIDPHDKENDGEALGHAKQRIAKSKVIYILGFGFDENNSRRIGLGKFPAKPRKTVMFTNSGDLNTVNKKASMLFHNRRDVFLGESIRDDPATGRYFEKSVRTVYEAFEMDFDAVEEQDV